MSVQGTVSAYLATLPQVSAAWGTRVAFLTSLRQVTILDTADAAWRCSFHTQEEPALLALSEHLVAMSCSNQVGCRPDFCDMCYINFTYLKGCFCSQAVEMDCTTSFSFP